MEQQTPTAPFPCASVHSGFLIIKECAPVSAVVKQFVLLPLDRYGKDSRLAFRNGSYINKRNRLAWANFNIRFVCRKQEPLTQLCGALRQVDVEKYPGGGEKSGRVRAISGQFCGTIIHAELLPGLLIEKIPVFSPSQIVVFLCWADCLYGTRGNPCK